MITTNDLKNGYVLDIDGELVSVVSFQHVKPGKGGAFVRTKLKSMTSGRGGRDAPSAPARRWSGSPPRAARCSSSTATATSCT